MQGTFGRAGSDWSAKRLGALLAGTGCAAGLVLAAAPAANALPTGCAQVAEKVTCTYTATGSEQTFTPPAGITSVKVKLSGGSGGAGLTVGGAGGTGATVSGTLTGVTGPLNVWAGTKGTKASTGGSSLGGTGYGAGGNGAAHTSGGGGGASAILNGTTAIVVAAGGGGGGGSSLGLAGGAGGAADHIGAHGAGGIGIPGAGGLTGTAVGPAGVAGGIGVGLSPSGGGGGGGNFGGAGGNAGVTTIALPPVLIGGGGGGGGSNLLSTGTSVTGTKTGNGEVSISYDLPALVITTTSLPGTSAGVAYSATLNATGATPPYTWAVTGGSLPAGLSLNPTTGVISGTPTTSGDHNFTVTATDSATPSSSVSETLSIEVRPAVTSVYLNSGLPGGGQITRINGAGLAGRNVIVRFGNARATVLIETPTQLTVDAPPGHGTVNVTVTVDGETSAITSSDRYTYY